MKAIRPNELLSRRLAALVAFTIVTTTTVTAQVAPAPVAVGARVRVTLPDAAPRRFGVIQPERRFVGELVALTPDTFALRAHPLLEPVRVPRSAVQRLEVSRGAPSRWQSAAFGAVGGALVGLLWGHNLYNVGLRGPRFDSHARARTSGAVFGAAGFALLGALFPTERWRRLPLE